MTIPGRRALNLAATAICVGLMGYALYAQHQLMLEPCPLCVLQRLAVIGLGIIFLVAALHHPTGAARNVYAGLLAVAGLFGIVVAGRHVWLQHLPADEIPSCGPGLDYMLENFPLRQVVDMVFTGSGECADVDWQLLGLSMPAWVLIAIAGLAVAGIWNNLRKDV